MTRKNLEDGVIANALSSLDEPILPEGLAQRVIANAIALPQEPVAANDPATNDFGSGFIDETAFGVGGGNTAKWLAGLTAIAACLTLAFFSIPFLNSAPTNYQTALGEQLVIKMDDGSSITLNGGTQLEIAGLDQRYARLVEGEAIFDVVHDPANSFVVETGQYRLVDLGTVFNVSAQQSQIEVAVAEGLVEVDMPGEKLMLEPGEMARLSEDGNVSETAIDPTEIGQWTQGQLVYDSEPMAQVADDLSRLSGHDIRIDSSLAQRQFSGALVVSETAPLEARTLSEILEVNVRQNDGYWLLSSR